jgi:uncharacterized protein
MTSGRSHPRAFAPLALSHTALLTTFRRTGEAVSTPVSVALDDGRAYFMTAADSGKAKRLARDPTVTLAPCTVRGTVIGATVAGQAHPLEGEERRRARRLLRPMAPLLWSYLLYRLRGKSMRLYEVTPARTLRPNIRAVQSRPSKVMCPQAAELRRSGRWPSSVVPRAYQGRLAAC